MGGDGGPVGDGEVARDDGAVFCVVVVALVAGCSGSLSALALGAVGEGAVASSLVFICWFDGSVACFVMLFIVSGLLVRGKMLCV